MANTLGAEAGAGVSQQVQPGGRAVRVTERDLELVAVLGMARFLSTEQFRQLFFPGRTTDACRIRLSALAAQSRRTRPLVAKHIVHDLQGHRFTAWSLTEAGFLTATRDGTEASPPPAHRVGPEFILRTVQLNQLLVALLRDERRGCRVLRNLEFRWRASDRARLEWSDGAVRVLAPDAVLEYPGRGQRIFLEHCAHGLAGLGPRRVRQAEMREKIDRYQAFLRGSRAGRAAYMKRFGDRLDPAVWFIVEPGEEARQRWADALAQVSDAAEQRDKFRVATFDELRVEFGGAREPVEPLPAIGAVELLELRAFYNDAITAIREARHRIRAAGARIPEPEYPTNAGRVREILER